MSTTLNSGTDRSMRPEMPRNRQFLSSLFALAVGLVAACGGEDSDSAADPDGGNDAADPDDDDAFRVTGRVASSANALRAAPEGETPRVVTHVMAVTPSSQDLRRILAEVGSDGSFSLDLDPSQPWVLVFVDSSRHGKDMIVGVFQADTLDTITPAAGGDASLGDVTIADSTASAGISYDALLEALGLDEATAALIGEVDDLCLRYVNPDIDDDGVIDTLQEHHDLRLDFHTHFDLGEPADRTTVDDLVGDFLDFETAEINYRGTGVYTAFPSSFYSGDLTTSAWASFDQTFYYQSHNPAIPSGMTAAGDQVPRAALVIDDFGGGEYQTFGPYGQAEAGRDLPQGEYRFGFGAANGPTTLTFTHVQTRTNAELAAAENFIMPFLKIVPTDDACTSACRIARIDYQWMKRSDSGWIDATAAELAVVVSGRGGFLSIVLYEDDGEKKVEVAIPTANPIGTVPWAEASVALRGGATGADLDAATTADLCHVGLSYDDKLGMRMFAGIGNAQGTCE